MIDRMERKAATVRYPLIHNARLESSRKFRMRTILLGSARAEPAFPVPSLGGPTPVHQVDMTLKCPQADILGAISLIFWTLTLIVLVKYVGVVLLADDEGEGEQGLIREGCRWGGVKGGVARRRNGFLLLSLRPCSLRVSVFTRQAPHQACASHLTCMLDGAW